ncbi:ATP phosphoribosyltransferase regulatory subunit [Hippea alviniae]|uniref:ATP phosphoribosyltransferase regulatory subunit n=1 Tax=Hippea alviniae TaxID=1279027 RepID=UPI0003B5B083|nr:ATP phosphoribosyltransferase regulatory subunit [Hippea alviniae]
MNRIPSGVVLFFEPLSSIRREAENKLISLFKDSGYSEIITPTFVYEDSVSEFLFEPLKNKLFKIVDKNSGQTMILRADITLQITQAVMLGDFDFPVRVCYAQNVYRDIKEYLGKKREFRQVGVELFGIKELDADEEIISLAVEGLKRLGFDDFFVRIGDTYILKELISKYNLSKEKADRLMFLVNKKNLSDIEKEGYEEGLISELKELQERSGFDRDGDGEIFELAKRIQKKFGLSVFCDLFYCEYPMYHHGIAFEILAKDKKLAVGGRYGNITKQLGKYIPATGFAINLDEVSQILFERRK